MAAAPLAQVLARFEKNQTSEEIIQLHLPFSSEITQGAATLGETWVTVATHADGDELVHLCVSRGRGGHSA